MSPPTPRRPAERRVSSRGYDLPFSKMALRYEPPDDVSVEHAAARKIVVRFTGEHDLSERDEVGRLLRTLFDENDLVVADFSEATFVDSTMMHALLEADMEARRRGIRFRLQLGTSAIVARAFELTGLDTRLDVAWSRAEALEDSE